MIQTSDSKEQVHGQSSQLQELFQKTLSTSEDQEVIILTESDFDSNIDYIPGSFGTDELSDSCSLIRKLYSFRRTKRYVDWCSQSYK